MQNHSIIKFRTFSYPQGKTKTKTHAAAIIPNLPFASQS